LAAATSGLGGQIGERLGRQEDQDRALRLSALQAAQGEYSAERADQRAAARAAAAGGRDRALGSLYDIYDAEGNLVQQAVPIATQSEYAQIMERVPGGRIAATRTAVEPVLREVGGTLYDLADVQNPRVVIRGEGPAPVLREVGGTLYDLSDVRNPQVVIPGEGPAPVLREFGGNMYDLSDPLNPQIVIAGETPRDTRIVGGRILDITDPDNPVVLYEPPPEGPSGEFIKIKMPDGTEETVRSDSPEADRLTGLGGQRVAITAAERADPLINPVLMGRYGRDETTPDETALIQARIARLMSSTYNFETQQYEQPLITPLVLQEEQARRNLGVSTVLTLAEPGEPSPEGQERLDRLEGLGGSGFGAGASVLNLINRAVSPTGLVPAPQTQDAINAVNALHEDAKVAFRDLLQGRPAQDAIDQFAETLPDPAIFFDSPRNAASKIQAILDLYNSNIAAARDMAASGLASATMRADLERAIISAQRMVDAYSALRAGILSGETGGPPVDPAQFRRPR
jgi:hypothetical protein